jgi:Zn-dependent protease with chaperone function
MRRILVTLIALMCGATWCDDGARAPEIMTVLQRSQQLRLDAMRLADRDSPRAQGVQASFDELVRRLPTLPTARLRVVRGETVAETLHGNTIVANETLADLPEGERLFIIAHELGHVMLGHWSQMGLLYQKWVPGAVTQQHTDAVADRLGRDASALAHRQEFEADAFAVQMLRTLGRSEQDAVAAFMELGVRPDTATHPATRKRIAALRSNEAADRQAAAPTATER